MAEGTPEELKRSIGQDLIVAEVEGDDPAVLATLRGLSGIDDVTYDGVQVVVSTRDGPAELSPVAIALNATSLRVRALTLRTPTLDDVFKELTGSHMHEAAPA